MRRYALLRQYSKERIKVSREIYFLNKKLYSKEDQLCDINYRIEQIERVIDIDGISKQLTEREKQIVKLRKEGKTLKEIAKELGLAYGTVKNYSMNIPNDI